MSIFPVSNTKEKDNRNTTVPVIVVGCGQFYKQQCVFVCVCVCVIKKKEKKDNYVANKGAKFS